MGTTSTKRTLEDRIERFISRFESERRDPDWWEGDKLILALSFLKRGDFSRGEVSSTRPNCRRRADPPTKCTIRLRIRL